MMKRTTGLIIIFVLAASSGMAQRREQQQEQDTIPELAGAEPVTGPMLVDGELPARYVEYFIRIAPEHSQKLSLFQNGLVTVTTTVDGRKSLKRVLFPPDAIDAYREHLNVEKLKRTNTQPVIATPTRLRETIRIYDDAESFVERRYDPSLYLPSGLENMRVFLQDLLRILIEDNEVTNPMTDYEPVSGDRLLDQQMKSWLVLRVVNEHVEVKSEDEPLRAWVKRDQLDEQFTSWSRSDARTE